MTTIGRLRPVEDGVVGQEDLQFAEVGRFAVIGYGHLDRQGLSRTNDQFPNLLW